LIHSLLCIIAFGRNNEVTLPPPPEVAVGIADAAKRRPLKITITAELHGNYRHYNACLNLSN